MWKVQTWPSPTTLTYPHQLHSQRDVTDVVSLYGLAEFLARNGISGTAYFQGTLRTEAGHWYKSKPKKFDMAQWLEPQQVMPGPTLLAVTFDQSPVLTPSFEPGTDQLTKPK